MDEVHTTSHEYVDVNVTVDDIHIMSERGKDIIIFTSKTNAVAIVDIV